MAAAIKEQEQVIQQPQQAVQAPAQTGQVTAQAAQGNTQQVQAQVPQVQAQPSPYAGIPGISEGTAANVAKYQTYQQSEAVTNAQNYLQSIVNGKPGDYASQYKATLDGLYDQIMNRKDFSYDLNGDMLYRQYADQYQRMGKRAMQDTMGQAAALTGGYGSSYATTAGEQAYQNYLAQLNDKIPELYDRAYGRYQQEGADMQNRFGMVSDLENRDYNRYRDTVADWNNNYQMANQEYWNQYNADYGRFSDDRSYWNQMAQQEYDSYQNERNYAYNYAMSMLSAGLMPDANWLELAGISAGDAAEIMNANKKSSGGGSSRRSSGGGSSSSSAPKTTVTSATKEATKSSLQSVLDAIRNKGTGGSITSTSLYTKNIKTTAVR